VYLNLFGPTIIEFISDKRYHLVIVDEYARCTWVKLLNHKDETFRVFRKFFKHIQYEKGLLVVAIRSDYRGEFQSENFLDLY